MQLLEPHALSRTALKSQLAIYPVLNAAETRGYTTTISDENLSVVTQAQMLMDEVTFKVYSCSLCHICGLPSALSCMLYQWNEMHHYLK